MSVQITLRDHQVAHLLASLLSPSTDGGSQVTVAPASARSEPAGTDVATSGDLLVRPDEVTRIRPGRRPQSLVGERVRVSVTCDVVAQESDGRLRVRLALPAPDPSRARRPGDTTTRRSSADSGRRR